MRGRLRMMGHRLGERRRERRKCEGPLAPKLLQVPLLGRSCGARGRNTCATYVFVYLYICVSVDVWVDHVVLILGLGPGCDSKLVQSFVEVNNRIVVSSYIDRRCSDEGMRCECAL